jgi:hypothetical protein
VFDVQHPPEPADGLPEFWTGEARMGRPNQPEEAQGPSSCAREVQRELVGGRLQLLPGSPVDRYLREEGGLIDAFSKVRGVSAHEACAFPTAGFMNLRMHLDHAYSSERLEWVDLAGTHPFGHRGSFSGLSDHVPLIARCRLP